MYEPRAETMAQGSPKLLTRRRQRLGHADYPLDRGVPGTALGYFLVESTWGAVSRLLSIRFPRSLAEPAVPVSRQRALHGFCR